MGGEAEPDNPGECSAAAPGAAGFAKRRNRGANIRKRPAEDDAQAEQQVSCVGPRSCSWPICVEDFEPGQAGLQFLTVFAKHTGAAIVTATETHKLTSHIALALIH